MSTGLRVAKGKLTYFEGDTVRHQVIGYDTIESGVVFVTIKRRGTICACVKIEDFIAMVPLNEEVSDMAICLLKRTDSDYE
jgi:hypothetical protein